MAQNKASRFFAFALLSMVIVGLIGFGSVNLSGTVRSVGTVGGKDLGLNTYARALQSELAAIEAQTGQQFPFDQAQLFGIDQQVLNRQITSRMMDAEAARLGISVGDENVALEISGIPAFQGIDGKFDRDSYDFVLEQNGLNRTEFEEQIRDDSARTILVAALLGGAQTNPAYARAFAAFFAETRDVTWAQLSAADVQGTLPTATDADLRAYYDANIADYTVPESRRITYAWLTPDMLLDTVEVNEDALRTAYERRIDEFMQPERRIVERLVFPDQAAADAAALRLAGSEASFEDLVAERGLSMIDVDMGDVTEAELGTAGAAVFAEPGLQVVGPVQTNLGPALFRVNVILPGTSTLFEEAIPALREDVAFDRAVRVIDEQMTDLDDQLAAGATLEELADTTDMQLGQISWHPGTDTDIAGYIAFRDAAAVVSSDDFPVMLQLEDGGVFALRLDGIDAAHPEDFDVLRDLVEDAWLRDQELAALQQRALDLTAELTAGTDFADLGLNAIQEADLTRRALIDGAPRAMVEQAFEMVAGDVTLYAGDGGVYLMRLDAVQSGDLDSQDNLAIINTIDAQTNAAIEQDMYDAYANLLRLRTEIVLNQQAINAVHANFQ